MRRGRKCNKVALRRGETTERKIIKNREEKEEEEMTDLYMPQSLLIFTEKKVK